MQIVKLCCRSSVVHSSLRSAFGINKTFSQHFDLKQTLAVVHYAYNAYSAVEVTQSSQRDRAAGWGLEGTYAVHLRLIGKRLMDFLLVIIELFR